MPPSGLGWRGWRSRDLGDAPQRSAEEGAGQQPAKTVDQRVVGPQDLEDVEDGLAGGTVPEAGIDADRLDQLLECFFEALCCGQQLAQG